jgi:lipoprotein-releasing system permease protein
MSKPQPSAAGLPSRGLPYEWMIGARQVRARRRNSFISFIALLSTGGIALGVASLIVVLAVIDGLQEELRSRILGVAAHVLVTGPEGAPLAQWPERIGALRAAPGVAGAAPYVEGQALLSAHGNVQGVMLRGIAPEQEATVSDVGRHMIAGELQSLQPGGFGLVLGYEVARALEVQAGDRVLVISPQGIVTPAGIVPRVKNFTVQGVFSAGMPEYDAGLALIDLGDAQRFLRLGDRVSGVRLRLEDLFDAPRLAAGLNAQAAGRWQARDWTRTHETFFRALQIEKAATFIMLSLIVAVAAFNVVSMLVMAVNEKRADIAILRTMGATPRSIQAIFIIQGAILGLVGTVLGDAAGMLIATHLDVIVPAIERALGTAILPADLYYVTMVPAQLRLPDVGLITGLSVVLCLLATLYPSWQAARTRPVEALRYG